MTEVSPKSYFLGRLSDDLAAEIEQRIIEDEDFAAEMSNCEEELIEEFLDSELDQAEDGLFRSNYLTTENRIKNVNLIRMLRGYDSTSQFVGDENTEATEERASAGWWWLLHLSSFGRIATISLLFIVLALGTLWFFRRSPGRDLFAREREYQILSSELNSTDSRVPSSALTLTPGIGRGETAVQSVKSTGLDEKVFFRLALPLEFRGEELIDASLSRRNMTLSEFKHLRPAKNNVGYELRLVYPSELLTVGSYEIRLDNENGRVLSYAFDIKE